MTTVWYAGIGAIFLLGLLFLWVYARRNSTSSAPHHGDAVTEAAALRQAAQSEAEGLRRAAEAEAEATRRAARTDSEAVRSQAEAALSGARAQADDLLGDARRAGETDAAKLTGELQRQRDAHAERVARLDEIESRLDTRRNRLDERVEELRLQAANLSNTKDELHQLAAELDAARDTLVTAQAQQQRELERVAGLRAEEAKAELLRGVESGARREAALLVRTIENEARSEGTERARSIVTEAVQRVASSQTTQAVVSVLHLPAEEMKGRIIGREGRNIRSFEAVTGVNVLIDDTPEAVLLSCFDPVRREVGRLTLEKLILDGRIHPHRIEEAYEQSTVEVDELCLRAARDAVADVGVGPIDERLMPTLGRLKYRTSYGQNVLDHLTETAHIAGVMAAELGIEPTLVKRCAFLHDIGKALTHEVEGSHAIVGAELLRKYGEDEAVAHAVEAHHNEVQPRTIEAVLTQASDTCSAARPGARRESLESYVKRLARIEAIASTRPGVEKVFAMQSGREVRVMVQPTEVDDLASAVLAREIAKQIEDELTYPGQIRVTVVRESRTTEIAH